MNKLLPSKRNAKYDRDNVEHDLPTVEGDKTAWDHYNEKARIDDREYVKDWNENLANLLIFAALFSAILTAFIIESMKLLQQDPQETTNNLLLFMTKQAVNATIQNATVLSYDQPDFVLQSYIIAVNCLFFGSLSLSLLAALASIIILQWVGRYDTGILSYPAAKDRGLHRQFRYDGVLRWRMNDLISALPYLLYFSLVFFFIGIIVWLFNTNKIVSIVVSTFFLIGILAYTITTIIAVVAPSAPFKTPLSDFFIAIVYQISPKRREEKEIESNAGFPLHTLMTLVGTIEIVEHSYATLSTVVREIVRQPCSQVFNSGDLFLQDRWYEIFQAVLSSFGNNDERQTERQDDILLESLADYAVSLLVQGAPKAQDNIINLFQIFSFLPNYENITKAIGLFPDQANDVDPTILSPVISSPVIHSPVYVYSAILNLRNITAFRLPEHSILEWLSRTIDIPLGELETAPLLSQTGLGSYLTAAAFLICSLIKTGRKPVTGAISSMQDFSSIVASIGDNLTKVQDDIHRKYFAIIVTRNFLPKIIVYNCALLARTTDVSDSIKTVEDIGHLMIPKLQEAWGYFPVYELLLAYSFSYNRVTESSFQKTLEKVLGVEGNKERNKGLTILISIDKLFKNDGWHPHDVTEERARNLLLRPLFSYGWGWLKPFSYTQEDLLLAKEITDPSLYLIASASSGQFLDLHLKHLRGGLHDNLFCAAAAYWISTVLFGAHDSILLSEEFRVLQTLLSVPNARYGLYSMLRIPVREHSYNLPNTPDKQDSSTPTEICYQRADQLLNLCDEVSLNALFEIPYFGSPLSRYITEAVRSSRVAMGILIRIEGSQFSPSLAYSSIISYIHFIGEIEVALLVEPVCLLWCSILKHTVDVEIRTVTSSNHYLLKRLASQPKSWFNEVFSQTINQQITLREDLITLGFIGEDEDGIWEWHLDLGFVHQVAFAPEAAWSEWMRVMKEAQLDLSKSSPPASIES